MANHWMRVRFHANTDDPRPVQFPPPGPYWVSGHAGDDSYAVIVAFVQTEAQITEYWPEADEIDVMQRDVPITFTARFAQPDWWTP